MSVWRRSTVQLLAACLVSSLLVIITGPPASGQGGVISAENRRPGTTDWVIADRAVSNPIQIKGYPSTTSLSAGERLNVFVSVSPAQSFSATVYRLGYYGGTGGRQVAGPLGPFDGQDQGLCGEDAKSGMRDCTWPSSFALTVGNDWVSGAYLIKLTRADGKANYVPFTVTDDRVADIIYQQPVTTWHAYNNYPDFPAPLDPNDLNDNRGRSYYRFLSNNNPLPDSPPNRNDRRRAVEVSFSRPLPANGSFLLLSMEHDLIMFLEQYGYDVTYQTDLDTHADPARLSDSRRPKAVVSAGHDEYWTQDMFDGFLAARDRGVDLAFIGANAAFWRVTTYRLNNGHLVMRNYRGEDGDQVTVRFRQEAATAEQRLVGVQYWGFQESGEPAVPFTATNTDHWIFDGTGLRDGDQVPGVIGGEVDRWYGPESPLDVLGPSYTQIGSSNISAIDELNFENVRRTRPAETVVYERTGATVFASATLKWNQALGGIVNDQEWRQWCPIRRMTGNLFDRFVGRSNTVPRCGGGGSPTWSVAPMTVDEAVGTAAVRVTLDPPAPSPVSINYATQAQSATGGSDFYGTSGTLNFAAGESTKTVPITILNDSIAEPTEQFKFRLFTAGPDIASAQVTIADDDAQPPQVTLETSDVVESAGSATATVRLSSAQETPIVVNLATSPGAAMKSEDFYGLYRQLTFAPGETVKRVDIVIVDDAIAEPYEQFTVRIWDEGGRTIATRSIGIVDDD